MPRPRRLVIVALGVALVATAACGQSPSGTPPAAPEAAALPTSSSSHVAVIVMENKEATDVVGTSASRYVTGLARGYAIATRSDAIAHPSLPNYLALTSGSTHGIASDCTGCHVAGPDVRRHARDSRPVDHYGVLRTIEDALGLPPLGGAALRRSGTLAGLFQRPPHAR